MAWEDNCRTTKVFFEPELRWGEYRTVRVYPTTTFAHLREKLLEKQKSCKDILSCYEIYFKCVAASAGACPACFVRLRFVQFVGFNAS